MPLVSVIEGLNKAQAGKYAIPCLCTSEQHGTQGIFQALEAKRAPGLLGIYSGILDRPDIEMVAAQLRSFGKQATVPFSIILDHGADFDHCMRAIQLGFTDVMYDGSQLPIEENIATTSAIVRVAHAMGVGVEAEIGHVGTGREYAEFGSQGKGFSDPDEVVRFVAETGVDCVAVAVGTAHGDYAGEPHLELDLLAEINERVEIPLVLHGGSGLSDEQFQATIERGICKINIFTAMANEARRRCKALEGDRLRYTNYCAAIVEGFQAVAEHCLDVFGASGKA